MKKIVLFFASVCAFALGQDVSHTRLLVFGGGSIPEAGVRRLIELSGGNKARVLFVPWAADKPIEFFKSFQAAVNQYTQPAEIACAPEYSKTLENTETFVSQLSRYSAIFFSGGDQNIVMDILDSSPKLKDAMVTRFQSGTVFSGKSAGLAMMSNTMLIGKDDDMTELDPKAIKTRPGLGLLDGAVLDQHFIRRNRMQRLLSVMLGSIERYGIGVDNDTGILVEDGRFIEVIGERKVVLIDRSEVPGKMTLGIYKSGDTFTLSDSRKVEPFLY